MFGRNDLVNIIKKGDLERLKKVLSKNPAAVRQQLSWKVKAKNGRITTYHPAALLHVASYFNQPELISYLVKEQGMEINRKCNDCSPLYYAACSGKSYEAVKTLLNLGAELDAEAYKSCTDQGIKDLLQPYHEEQLNQTRLKAQEEKRQQAEAKQAQAAVNAAGVWKAGASPDQVIFEREVSGLRLTETFNFTAKTRILIAESLQTGNLAQPETKSFSEIPEMAEMARAELAKLRGPKLVLRK